MKRVQIPKGFERGNHAELFGGAGAAEATPAT